VGGLEAQFLGRPLALNDLYIPPVVGSEYITYGLDNIV
jgi:hypothetical protein